MPAMRARWSLVLITTVLAAVGFSAGSSLTALAYPGIGAVISFSTDCSSAAPGQSCAVHACVTNGSGQPETGVQVRFSSSDSSIAKVKPSAATTGSDGCVSGVQMTAGPHCGNVTLTAATGDASAQTQVQVTCSGNATGQVAGAQTGGAAGTTGGGTGNGGGAGTNGGDGGVPPATGGSSPSHSPAPGGGPPLALVAGIPLGAALLVLLAFLLLRGGRGRFPLPAATLLGRAHDADEVVPGLIVSSAPAAAQRRRLARLGVARVVDLRSESLAATWPEGVSVERLPLSEGEAPSLEQLDALVQRMESWLRDGERVLVHCTGGIGRAATVAVALLVRRGYSVGDAYRLVRERRSRVAPSDRQLDALTRYAQRLGEDRGAPTPAG